MKAGMGQKRLAVAAVLLCVVFASLVIVAPAAAKGGGDLPEFDGLQRFPGIQAPGDPDEFSWRVRLGEDQTLRLVTESEAWVEYEDGLKSFAIIAEAAKDRSGALVPTTLRVSEGDVLTLVVHDREGNPAASGAPFAYPIVPASYWAPSEVHPIIVEGPPDEMEIAEARLAEQRAKEAQQAAAAATPTAPTPVPGAASPGCTVPSLRGLGLRAAKAKLRAGHCGVGTVRTARAATAAKGKVIKQSPPVGARLAAGASVAIELGARQPLREPLRRSAGGRRRGSAPTAPPS